MALEVDEAQAVGAGPEVEAAIGRLGQHPDPGLPQAPGRDRVPARVRRVEAGVGGADQGVGVVDHPVLEDAPLLVEHPPPVDAVQPLDQCVGREAGAQGARHVLLRPLDQLTERLPERLVGEVLAQHVRTRQHERVDVGGRLRATLDARQGERVHDHLDDLVRPTDQPHELLLGRA